MKQQVFYIHGGESYENHENFLEKLKTREIWDLPSSSPNKKWTSTLAADLGEEYEVFMPVMPNKQNAKYEEWKIWFERHFEHLNDGVILMGHSLGAMFLTRYLSEESLSFSPKAVFLLAPAAYNFSDPETGEDGGDFNCDQSKLENINKNTESLIIFHSKDDFVIPYDHSECLKKALPQAELVTFEDKGHFLVEELPELVERIKAIS